VLGRESLLLTSPWINPPEGFSIRLYGSGRAILAATKVGHEVTIFGGQFGRLSTVEAGYPRN